MCCLCLNFTEFCSLWFSWQHQVLAWCQSGTLQWRHYGHGDVSNHQPHYCLLNHLFRRISKKITKIRITGLCARNSPVTSEFPSQMASNAEKASIWWHHHVVGHYQKQYWLWSLMHRCITRHHCFNMMCDLREHTDTFCKDFKINKNNDPENIRNISINNLWVQEYIRLILLYVFLKQVNTVFGDAVLETMFMITSSISPMIARFMGPTWGPPGSCLPQMGPMLAPWTLLSGILHHTSCDMLHHFTSYILWYPFLLIIINS